MLLWTYAVQFSTDLPLDPERLKRALAGMHPGAEVHFIEWLPSGPIIKCLGTGVIEPPAPVTDFDQSRAVSKPAPPASFTGSRGSR
jgi:hypothetical protein